MVKLRVAVIGAGPAGLAMCKELMSEQDRISFVVFEKTDQIGGVWVYTKNKQDNPNNHSAMYKNLRTNLPKEVMAYVGFPFPENTQSYMSREVVLKYLQEYTDHFGLRVLIKFNNEVVSVRPIGKNESPTWQVQTREIKSGIEKTEMFDAVVVCNGHFFDPSIPEIPGMAGFPGIVKHSFYYSEPDEFKNRVVLILGVRNSAVDLCIEASRVAKKVYIVHYGDRISAPFSENVEELLGTLTHAYADGSVEVANKYRIKVDFVVFCTGYNRSFPFLSPDCEIKVTNNRVTSLYKHVFNTKYPSLAFVGLCDYWPAFPYLSLQSQWVASIITGRKVLPCREEMLNDEEMEYQERVKEGVRPRLMHTLGVKRLKSYADMIAQLAGVSPLPPVIFSLYKFSCALRFSELLTYRDTHYSVNNDEFQVIKK